MGGSIILQGWDVSEVPLQIFQLSSAPRQHIKLMMELVTGRMNFQLESSISVCSTENPS